MNQLQLFLFIRIVLVMVLLGLGGGVMFYADNLIDQTELDKRLLRRDHAHKRVLNRLEYSFDNFATIVSGLKSHIELSAEMPDARELQYFINSQIEQVKYDERLIVSFIDTTHTFVYVFTRDKMDPAQLTGKSVRDFRDTTEIKKLDQLLETDGIQVYEPLNLKEGWLGIPFDFRVVRNDKVVGYIAPLLDLKVVLDNIYEDINSEEYVLRFSTSDSIDFDRQGYYDGSTIFNTGSDSEFYKNYEVNESDFVYQFLDVYGIKFRIGIALKNAATEEKTVSNLLLGWYITLSVFMIAVLFQSYFIKKINLRYIKANDLLTDQKEQISKQSEQLEKNLSFISKVANISPAHIYIFDLNERRNVYENKNISQYLGFDKDVLISPNQLVSKHLHSSNKTSLEDRLTYYVEMEDNVVSDTTVQLLDINDQWRWFLGKELVFRRNEQGVPDQILGIAEDITKVKQIESKLAENAKRLMEAQSISKVGHWEVNLNTSSANFSEEFSKIYCMNEGDKKAMKIDGNYFQNFIHPNDTEKVNNNYQHGLKTGEQYDFDYRIIDRMGNLKYVHSIVHFDLNQKMIPIKAWGTIQDITDRKMAEELLESRYDDLERVNAELDRFAYSVTHDLKAPLSNILGLISLTKEEQNKEQLTEYCTLMELSVYRMNRFIDELTIYARNANLEIKKGEVNLKGIIGELLIEHKFTEGADKIEFELEFLDNDVLFSDQSRIRIVLNNLISNAIKYHDFKKVRPYIRITKKSDQLKTIIKVIDNGTGMSKSDSEKIFDMFYRALGGANSTEGSGVGLYILSKALEKVNGTISVESELGMGTTFTVELPNE